MNNKKVLMDISWSNKGGLDVLLMKFLNYYVIYLRRNYIENALLRWHH